MRRALILFAIPALLSAAEAPKAELKTGLGVEHFAITGESSDFTIAPDTKIFVAAQVTGVTDGTVTIVFLKDEKSVAKQDLKVPHSPYRTHAYRTFRKGDSGAWTVKAIGADGAEMGSMTFNVSVKENG